MNATEGQSEMLGSEAGGDWDVEALPAPDATPQYGARKVERLVKPGSVQLTVKRALGKDGLGVAKDNDGLQYRFNQDTEGALALEVGQRFKAKVSKMNYVIKALAVSGS